MAALCLLAGFRQSLHITLTNSESQERIVKSAKRLL